MLVRGRSPDSAKFGRPRLARVHPRERLFLLLDECLEQGAVWVSGPPGAGKTALVASYLDARELPALWYHTDSGDRDPVLCCHCFEAAVSGIAASPGGDRLPLNPAQTTDLRSFIGQFLASFYDGIGVPNTIVLDDCQEALVAPEFRELLATAVRMAPSGISWIIVSRTQPPADFTGLRAKDRLAVLGPDQLLLSEDESIALQQLSTAGGGRRSLDHMRQAHRLTCGWPAGLKLLSQVEDLALLDVPDTVRASHSALFQYLATEIFDRQSPNVRGFLLRVAYLPRMAPAMADQLAGSSDASRILATMHSDNLLTTLHAVGGEMQYEFHPLLRQFLLVRARIDLPPDERRRIELLAASVLAAQGELDAAASTLIGGAHWPELESLIVGQAQPLIKRGWQRTLSAWLDALPAGHLASNPWLQYWRGSAWLPFDPPAAQTCFEDAYRLFRACRSRDGSCLAWSAVVDLICLEWSDFSQLDRWLDEADSLQQEFGAPTGELVGRCTSSMFGALLFRRPQDPAIHVWAERLLAVIDNCPDPQVRILLACNLQLHYTVGVGDNALLDRLTAAIEPPPGSVLAPFVEALLWAERSMHHWSRGEMKEGAAAADTGSRLARQHGVRMWDFLLGALQTYAYLNQGDAAAGRLALARLAKCLDPRRRIDVGHHHYLACLSALLADDGAQAVRHGHTTNAIATQYGGPQQHALGRLLYAQALHAAGRTVEAWPLLAEGREIGVAMRSGILCFQADLCEALLALDSGDDEGGVRALRSAFSIGAAHGYLNHNSFRPSVMARLCAVALARQIEPDYVRCLIRRRGLRAPGVGLDCWPWPVRIYTLGRLSIVVDGRAVVPSGQQHKPVDLLQAIVALGGRHIAISRLIDSLWSDAESRGGRGAFDASLLRLRRLLGHDDAILTDGGRVSLNETLCWVDLWSFERLLNRTEEALARHVPIEPDELERTSDSLLALYRGDFLERESAHAWLLPRRERSRQRVVEALAEIAHQLETGARWREAIRLYRRIIEIDPLAEACYRRLMVSLQRTGETAEALRVHARCREVLHSTLGATPSRETEAVFDMLRHGGPANPPASG
ncbi:MAG: hypothetical protein HT579_12220 [Candidatus Accumulibacter similis]|nr:MAG: hypothetical protein HT579_12220 [Candidatus Accumulibacter similis]